ncbi:FecR family protein [Rubripirellula reticaptiva]|uniref:FecR protein n=1 Tax=Rubripirellula reticaptiva TaxID=2528013 RepID=A0A5C6EPV2_9BACT|nr:FecR family protein [Rubripirellula reticaptiva]TWU51793.1 FecR protein [Rubripirellula reticaptiva]
MSSPTDKQNLIADYAAGTIEADAFRELEKSLRRDAEFRRDFIEYLNLDSSLSDLAALSDSEFDAINSEHAFLPEIAVVVPSLSWQKSFVLGGIAAAVLLTVGIVWFTPTTEPVTTNAAGTVEIISLDAARLAGVDQDVRVGDRLDCSRIRLETGTIRVRLDSGVILDLYGPLEGSLESSMRLRLTQGRLNADVGEFGQGFTIVTDHGEIIDLGTRFGVDVSDDEASVAVFDGEVKVKSQGDANMRGPIKVFEGEGVRLRKGRRPRRLSAVWLSQEEFNLSASDASSTVVDVTDNSKMDGFHRFYGIMAGGMREGTIAYTSHASTPRPDVFWHAAEGEEFPAELLGADVVCPFHIDRQEQTLSISLQLGGSANVYVMHDLRRKPSAWLQNDFQKTQFTLRSGPWRPVSPLVQGIEPNRDGDLYVQYSVWKKRVDVAGSVKLGPPQTDGDRGNKAMYGIAVKGISKQ